MDLFVEMDRILRPEVFVLEIQCSVPFIFHFIYAGIASDASQLFVRLFEGKTTIFLVLLIFLFYTQHPNPPQQTPPKKKLIFFNQCHFI